MNAYYLGDDKMVKDLKERWKSYPQHLGCFGKLCRIIRWYKEFCKEKTRSRREVEETTRNPLESEREKFFVNLKNIEAQEGEKRAREALQRCEE